MTKIKLTETFQTPKDLPLDINGFDVPNVVMVDFTTARAGYAYNAIVSVQTTLRNTLYKV